MIMVVLPINIKLQQWGRFPPGLLQALAGFFISRPKGLSAKAKKNKICGNCPGISHEKVLEEKLCTFSCLIFLLSRGIIEKILLLN